MTVLNQELLRRQAETKLNFIFPTGSQAISVMVSMHASSARARTHKHTPAPIKKVQGQ
jgi:hypothetical protein